MINRVILTGRLTDDPQFRYTPSGVAVVTFTLAVTRPFANQNGVREADFMRCVAWRKQAENIANYLKKGSMVGIDGRLETGSYERNGRRVYYTQVVVDTATFLEPRNASNSGRKQRGDRDTFEQEKNASRKAREAFMKPSEEQRWFDDPFADNGEPIEINDDDLPF
ncbi:single-stranded DNA-binding protein [Geobacillus thermodenitrificans]|uniref:single-stranded DNA-binding protein n=1 Tax=Geobacillus thermodenitrificans TaxID=33940 RepID=UPI003D210341